MDDGLDAYRFELAQSFYRVIEDFCEGALLVDAGANIQWINEGHAELFGMNIAHAIGRPVESILPQSEMRSVVESGKAHPLVLMQFGERFHLITRLPLRDPTGRVIGAFAFGFKDSMTNLPPLVDRIRVLNTQLNQAERALVAKRSARYTFENIIGVSPAMIQVRRQARRAAQVPSSVLLLGETGTGKELVAQAIHSASPRFGKPFIGINMTAIPESLMEAEFFGVAPGAYTGAGREARPGKFQLADHGTLFLDEIADIPPPMQAKLLRVLQEQEVEPLGSNKLVKIDVRVIAATHRDLLLLVEKDEFRRDLYYRLNVLPIRLPPLRERKEDIELLAFNTIERVAHDLHSSSFEITPDALDILARHDWPGNVRELGNIIEQACVGSENGVLDAATFEKILPAHAAIGHEATTADGDALGTVVDHAEFAAVVAALQKGKGNKASVARMLGISRTNLYAKMNKYGLH